MIRILPLLLIFLTMAPGVRAEPITIEALQERLNEKYDDPKTFRLELESWLTKITPDASPELWTFLHAHAAEASWFQEEIDLAKHHAEIAIPVAQKHGFHALESRLTYVMGGVLEYEARTEDAEPYYLKAVELAKATHDPALVAYITVASGAFFHRAVKRDQALAQYKEAFQLFPKLPQDAAYFDMLSSIGTLYAQLVGPRRDEGIQMVKDALDYSTQHKLRYEIFWINQALVTFYTESGEYDKIEPLLSKNLQVAQSLGYETYIANTLLDRGKVRMNRKNFQEALGDLETARKYYQQKSMSFYDIAMVSNLGIIYVALKQYDKIPKLLADFPNAIKDSSSSTQKEQVKSVLQAYYQATGQYDKELPLLRELRDLVAKNSAKKSEEEIGRLARDMEVQRQQFLNDKLTNENQLQNAEIQRGERMQKLMLGVLVLGTLALAASGVALRRGRKIKQQRANLKIILDNIEEGILRFGPDLIIQGEYSRYAGELLMQTETLRGRSVWDLLFHQALCSAEDRQIWLESLRAMFGEGRLAWELNEANLPRELHITSRILALDWQALADKDGNTQTIMLLIRDITLQVEMQKETQVAQERVSKMAERIEAIARGRPLRVAVFLLEAEKSILPLQNTINMDENYSDIKRLLHTLKGAARSLGLKDVSEIVHGFEDLFTTHSLNHEAFAKYMQDLQNSLNAYRELVPHLNMVQGHTLENLWDIASNLMPEARQRLASCFPLPAEFQLIDNFSAWDRVDAKSIHDILLHAVTNSIDHGFLLPHARGERMEDAPSLSLEARELNSQLELSVRDNGFGINWQKLESMAAQRGFQPAPGRELTDLLFLEGTSTAGQVSTTSGRGMGMSAIRDIVLRLGGDVSLVNNDRGRGTRLCIRIPTSAAAISAA